MRWWAAGLVPAVLVLSATGSLSSAGGPVELLRWQDPRIAESSGLVDLGDRLVTTNDSGDPARLFVVDLDGRTERVVDYGSGGVTAVDVEALAPAGDAEVWVGDIGDNARVREEVAVHRVRVDGQAADPLVASYRLAYPDARSYDAESLVVDPGGRLHVITKQLTGGEVYAAPRRLDPDGPNLLEPVARVAELATDAALAADGRHVLVRGYASVGVYALPDWRRVADAPLPEQEQGEAISVGPDGRVLLSSEGAGTAVLQVDVPVPDAASPGPTSPPPAGAAPEEPPSSSAVSTAVGGDGVLVAGLATLVAAVLLGVAVGVRAARRHRREPERRTGGGGVAGGRGG